MYNEIKKNFIEKFINVHFRYSVVSVKKCLFEKMNNISPFELISNEDMDKITVNLGDNVKFDLNLKWIETPCGKCTHYRLLEVN